MIEGMVAVAELTGRERRSGGFIRHSLDHGDLGIENVALNNLLAARNRLSTDIYGNKFPAQFVLSPVFWERAIQDARSHSIIPEYVARDHYGGMMDIVGMSSLHQWEGATCLLYTPHNDTVWELEVGDKHDIVRREECLALLGPNKGFDLIVPYLPALGVHGNYPALGYAPPELLTKWIDEGYESPKNILTKIGELPPPDQMLCLSDWRRAGWLDSERILFERGLLAPEVLAALPEPERVG